MEYARMIINKNKLVSLLRLPVVQMSCFVILAVATPYSAQAQSWRIEPIVKVGAEYDDNATLDIRTDEEVQLEGYLLDFRANIKYASETTSFFLQPRALLRDYGDEPDFDSNDFFLRSQFDYKGRANSIGFRANFDQQTIRTAEREISDLEIDDPDEITHDDTGLVPLSGTRDKWRISPYWKYQLSNISSIGADLDYFDVRYEDVFEELLTDYTDARLNLNYRRAFSNVQTGLVTVTARNFDTAAALRDITGVGLKVGFERLLSEKMRLTAMIGLEDINQSGVEFDPEVVADLTLIRKLETISMFVQYRRSVSASGASRLAVRNSFNLNFRRRLNEKISAGIGIRAYQSRGLGGSASFDDRNYVQLQSVFFWYLSQSLVIEASYRYTIIDRGAGIGERANSNQMNLWFVYQPRTIPKL